MIMTKRTTSIGVAIGVAALLIVGLAAAPASADLKGHPAVGTWWVTSASVSTGDPIFNLATFHPDGSVILSEDTDDFLGGIESMVHGVWEPIPPLGAKGSMIRLTNVTIVFDVAGNHIQTLKAWGTGVVTGDNTMEAEFFADVFLPGQNPAVDDPVATVGPFPATGDRLLIRRP